MKIKKPQEIIRIHGQVRGCGAERSWPASPPSIALEARMKILVKASESLKSEPDQAKSNPSQAKSIRNQTKSFRNQAKQAKS